MKQGNVIEIEDLTVRFGRRIAVDRVSMNVPRGSLFALLGADGAGKSSLVRALMNLLRPSSGRTSVLNTPSSALEAGHFKEIGYVAGEGALPGWMSPRALVKYCRPFYPGWDDPYCGELLARFRIPLDRRIRDLSKPAKAKLALVASLAYRPSLLVLDEPFGGLDTAARNECIAAILDMIDQEDWSLFLASSNIDEVERLADWVGLVHQGELKFAESINSLKHRFRQVEVVAMDRAESSREFPGTWIDAEASDHHHRIRFVDSRYREGETEAMVKEVVGETCSLEVTRLPLREIFRALARAYGLSTQS